MLLQDALDGFIRAQALFGGEKSRIAETCIEHLARYLLHYSDLFDDEMPDPEETPPAEWEQALDSHMHELMQGDVEPPLVLYDLELEQLDPSHLRDFFGWYLPREQNGDASAIADYAAVMRDWLDFLRSKGRLDKQRHVAFMAQLAEIEPEAARVVKAARLLYHFARLAHGLPETARGEGYSRFVEGHARVSEIRGKEIMLHFDSQPDQIGPLLVSPGILGLLRIGDVLDVELGMRGGVWTMVDVGPVYPQSVYVEAEEFEPLPRLL